VRDDELASQACGARPPATRDGCARRGRSTARAQAQIRRDDQGCADSAAGGRREFRRASLVSLNKLEQFRTPPVAGTFPTIFRTQDADAMSFIMRRYASVRLAETLDRFNRPGRAIMKDGLYDDGLVRSHRWIDPSQHKIGKSNQANALRALREQAEDLDKALADAAKETGVADAAFMALKALCAAPAGDLKACAAAFATAQTEKADAQAELAALDSAGDGGLREKKSAQQRLKNVRLSNRKLLPPRSGR
jgi:chromosome segregation ATPase